MTYSNCDSRLRPTRPLPPKSLPSEPFIGRSSQSPKRRPAKARGRLRKIAAFLPLLLCAARLHAADFAGAVPDSTPPPGLSGVTKLLLAAGGTAAVFGVCAFHWQAADC